MNPFKRTKWLVPLALMTMMTSGAWAQAKTRKNLPNFDARPYHFGFLLSANRSDFKMALADSLPENFKSIANLPQAGFNMHLMASYKLNRHMSLRFAPGLSFQDRGLDYAFTGGTSNAIKRTEAVNLDIPLLLKWRTDRVNNWAAYTLTGIKYARDFQSQEDVNQQAQSENILRLQAGNLAVDVGAGVDLFLPFFKFSIQAKTEHGLIDVLIQDNNNFTRPLDYLRTRSFVLSFCFEG